VVITISILHGCSNATCPCPSSSDVSRPRASSFDTSCPSGYRQSARARASSSATQPMRHADTTHVRRQFASRRGVERAPSKVPRPITASRCARQTSLTPWRPSTRCRTSVQPSTLPLHWHCPASPWERNTCPLWGEVTSLVHTWQVNRSPRAAGTDQRSASFAHEPSSFLSWPQRWTAFAFCQSVHHVRKQARAPRCGRADTPTPRPPGVICPTSRRRTRSQPRPKAHSLEVDAPAIARPPSASASRRGVARPPS